jgi:peptide/nickel transport system substrate-binding protein
MARRTWTSLAMLATGGVLLISAQLAPGASERRGGVMRVGIAGASVEVDPQVAYITTSWWMQYATAAKLYNYPDRKGPAGMTLQPEVASRYVVSNGGKRYTFFIRKGFRFSDGSAVTGRNFKYAIDRAANKELASPAANFIIDPHGAQIVGAKRVNDGDAQSVSGVQVRGNRLIINLTKADATFLAKITMPFFQATHTKLPLAREVVTINSITDMPSAGPYAYSRNEVNRLTSIRQNPFYRRGPGRQRPRNLTGLDVQWNLNEQTAFNQVKSGELDEVSPPAAEIEDLVRQYGVNRSRFWAMPQNCIGFMPMNMANDLFRGNPNLRRAINYALDRGGYIAQAGAYAGDPWSRVLTRAMLGRRYIQPYPVKGPDLRKARALAAGRFRDGKITIYYRSSGTINLAQYEVVRRDLVNLGFDSSNITARGFSGGQIYTAMGRRGTDADIGVSMGWCSDYPDPADWIFRLLFHGDDFNYSQMNIPKWNRKIEAAARLVGPKRFKAFARLDLDIMRQVAPIAVARTFNNRYFFSDRVDPKSLIYQGIYQDWSIPALALK